MFSNYDEVSKLIRSYIEDSLNKITGDVSMLTHQI